MRLDTLTRERDRDDLPPPPNLNSTGLGPDQPSGARQYDYYLGSASNAVIDRAAAEWLIAQVPEVPLIARTNRAFMDRAVRWLAGQGILGPRYTRLRAADVRVALRRWWHIQTAPDMLHWRPARLRMPPCGR
jgi:hypothetical protein